MGKTVFGFIRQTLGILHQEKQSRRGYLVALYLHCMYVCVCEKVDAEVEDGFFENTNYPIFVSFFRISTLSKVYVCDSIAISSFFSIRIFTRTFIAYECNGIYWMICYSPLSLLMFTGERCATIMLVLIQITKWWCSEKNESEMNYEF